MGTLRGLPADTRPSLCPAVVYQPPLDDSLPLVFEDHALLVLNKPSGLLSVPGRGVAHQDCLAHRVQARYADAMVVHRLDLATSGLVVMGRGLAMQSTLSQAFQARTVSKRYEAVLCGLMPQDEGEVDLPLITDWRYRPMQKIDHDIGKPARTRWRVLSRNEDLQQTRVELEPITGRSHQLRVHMLALGFPIVGDPLYGPITSRQAAPRLLLHASRVALPHPENKAWLQWCCPPPF